MSHGNPLRGIRTMPKLHMILGPMFSGKTSLVQMTIRKEKVRGQRTILIKWKQDRRFSDDMVISHDEIGMDAVVTDKLLSVPRILDDYDVVGIDEGQFFDDLHEFCEAALKKGMTVIVSALNGNFLKKPFKVISDTISIATKITLKTAICDSCCGKGVYNKRLADDKTEILTGGAELYKVVCHDCYEMDWRELLDVLNKKQRTMS